MASFRLNVMVDRLILCLAVTNPRLRGDNQLDSGTSMQQAPSSFLSAGSQRSADTDEALVRVFSQTTNSIAGVVLARAADSASNYSES